MLREKLKNLPEKPGVYLMKNAQGKVIYVGKAKILKNRVRQYFQSQSRHEPKVRAMVSHVDDFEYIITDTEVEALILENNLIKEYDPQYNIMLRDDKTYPYIKVTVSEDFPRVVKTREVKKDKNRYFGPYTNGFAVNDILQTIRETYLIRTCKRDILKSIEKKERPCLNFYIKKCVAPCTGNFSKEEYMEMIEEILEILDGKSNILEEKLTNQMVEYSKKMEYEEAARIRDKLKNLKVLEERQKIETGFTKDQDYVGASVDEDTGCIQVFFYRNGKIMGREHFIFKDIQNTRKEELLGSFIKQFYSSGNFIPKEIIIGSFLEEKESIEEFLTQIKGQKVSVVDIKKGERKSILDMVEANAKEALDNHNNMEVVKLKKTKGVIKSIQELLELEKVPNRIEAFDISNIQGVDSVGGQVVFIDGKKEAREYRRYKIKEVEGPNDYASLEEVLRRRLQKENHPDLILMDGGKGQYSVAKKVLKSMNLDIPVYGMVKDDRHRTDGLIGASGEIKLKRGTLVYQFISQIQEEVHRFAISYHRSLRKKHMTKSILDDIQGIGSKRKMALLLHFKTIENLKNASIEELASIDGMNKKVAQEIKDFFGERDKNGK